MRIPTYRQKTARPRQGSGQMFRSRLNASAMAAPALAMADAGKQLAQTGGQIEEFGYKKALAASEAEAAKANSEYQIKLQDLEEELLRGDDMVKAEKEFQRRSKQLQQTYSKNLSNTLGRKSFGALSASTSTKSSLRFSRLANNKLIDQATAATNNKVFVYERNAADLSQTPVQRLYEIAELRRALEEASPIIGYDKAAEKMRGSFANIMSGILNNKMDAAVRRGENPHDVVEDWMAGRDTDEVLAELDTVVSDKEKAKIKEKLLQNADRIDRRAAREEKRKADLVKADITETKRIIFSVNRGDPKSVAAATAAHEKMVRLNLYNNRAERKNAELMLGIGDDPGNVLREKNQGNPNVYYALKTRANSDTLSAAELNQVAHQLDADQFKEISAEVSKDRSAAERAAEDTIRNAFLFYKNNPIDDKQLKELASRSYRLVTSQLGAWQRENRNAGPVEIEKKTQELIAAVERPFRDRQIEIAFEQISSNYQNLRVTMGNRPFGVDLPTRDNLPLVLEQIRAEIAVRQRPEDKLLRDRLYQLRFSIQMATGGR